jgi:hypothetical protein
LKIKNNALKTGADRLVARICPCFHPNDLTPPVAGSGKLTAVPGGVSGMAHSFGDFKLCRLTEWRW